VSTRVTDQERLDWRRDYACPEFLKEGFRPLFMAAGIWAALAVPLWVAVWNGVISYDGAFATQVWHIHEMMFGFIAAAVGGFILTAVPYLNGTSASPWAAACGARPLLACGTCSPLVFGVDRSDSVGGD
jgi:uncharacterized protein involved in response to NO